jgi:uncharacterized protein (TIGR02599 family)
MMVLLAHLTGSASNLWRKSVSQGQRFREPRRGMETIQRTLSQATLNTYFDYLLDSSGNPTSYGRMSELRFICGPSTSLGVPGTSVTQAIFFQAPTGDVTNASLRPLNSLLNTQGFYIQFGEDPLQPTFVAASKRYRFRLMQLIEPSESLSIYTKVAAASPYNGTDWFTDALGVSTNSHVLAENIIALIFRVRDPANPGTFYYSYSSAPNTSVPLQKHQLPPVVDVTLVAVDEQSFNRIQGTSTSSPDLGLGALFQTAANYSADLATLESTLVEKGYDYRVFASSVSIEGAKWSTQ